MRFACCVQSRTWPNLRMRCVSNTVTFTNKSGCLPVPQRPRSGTRSTVAEGDSDASEPLLEEMAPWLRVESLCKMEYPF